MLVVACSSDDAVVVDAGDATMDAQDAADVVDAHPLDEPYPCCIDEPYPPVDEGGYTFQQTVAKVYCTRVSGCCSSLDAGAFDYDACVGGLGLQGWEGANADFLVPFVVDGGRIAHNGTAETSCLAGLATMSCDMSSNEHAAITSNCAAAFSGTSAIGGPCRADIECVQGAYCDTSKDGGACVTLVGQDAACQRTDQCAYKGFGSLYCNGTTCQPRLANDASCGSDDTCESGICANAACASAFEVVTLCAQP